MWPRKAERTFMDEEVQRRANMDPTVTLQIISVGAETACRVTLRTLTVVWRPAVKSVILCLLIG